MTVTIRHGINQEAMSSKLISLGKHDSTMVVNRKINAKYIWQKRCFHIIVFYLIKILRYFSAENRYLQEIL